MLTHALPALLLPVLVSASPQYMLAGDTACGDDGPEYTTKHTADVTSTFGDQGWINYSGNVCTAGTGGACSLTEGTSTSVTISVSFGGGPSFDLSKAVHLGLDFGASVAFTDTKSQSGTESCVQSGDDQNPCACGLQYKTTQQNAQGTYINGDGACGHSPPFPFDVTSPVLIDGKPQTEWRTCRAAVSKCPQMVNSPACADGL